MSRIGASLGTFDLRLTNLLRNLSRQVEQSTLRLATGKRINSAADDPAGLVFVNLQKAELVGVEQGLSNVRSAQSLVDSADGALIEAVTHLTNIRALALESADGTLSDEQLNANQDELDAAIDAIDRLAGTSFAGNRLLDGSQGFVVTGVDPNKVRTLTVIDRATQLDSQTIAVNVTVDASQAVLTYAGAAGALVDDTATISVSGSRGSVSVDVTDGEALTAARDRINEHTAVTGVSASVSGNNLVFTSVNYGSDATLAVAATTGTFTVTGGNGDGTAEGVDAQATINGTTVSGDRLELRYRSSSLDFDLELNPSFTTGSLGTISVSGQALSFQIAPSPGQPAVLSLPNIQSSALGGALGRLSDIRTGGSSSVLSGNAADAFSIADDAFSQLLTYQTRVGAFSRTTLNSAESVLSTLEENLTAAIDAVEKVDEARESALLARNHLLAENAISALAISADLNDNLLRLLQRIAYG
jgi:flagellin